MEACNTIEPVALADFVPEVLRFKMDGWRVVQICARPPARGLRAELLLRQGLRPADAAPDGGRARKGASITQIYPGAFLLENEAAELFGVQIEEIVQDYHGKLYRIAEETPFKHKG